MNPHNDCHEIKNIGLFVFGILEAIYIQYRTEWRDQMLNGLVRVENTQANFRTRLF